MLNQALKEIQVALETLKKTVPCEQNEAQLSENLEKVIESVTETIYLLQDLEKTFETQAIQSVSVASPRFNSQGDYYSDTWQKTA